MTIAEAFSLLGGVGLFLFGMTMLSSGLKNACGNKLQSILEKATSNKIVAVFVGIAVTMLIQSSSATDVMVIGFVNSGMMNLTQAISVIMGANIGTTITAQITAFNLETYAPLILFVGTIMYIFVKKSMVKYVGEIIMGFGMLFVGISIMKASIAPLAKSPEFIHLLSTLDSPWLALLFGIAFTALLQSSSSSTVIFQTFAIQGILAYDTVVYLVIGAAIGSVTPNLLASLTTNRNGKRTALLNLIFNIIRAGILVLLINLFPQILDLIQSTTTDIGRQVANTHTIFAIMAVLIELPMTRIIIAITKKLLPVMPEESEQAEERKLLYMANLDSMPIGIAIDYSIREVARMGRISAKNLRRSLDCFFDYSPERAESVRAREETVNILNSTISNAMTQLRTLELSSDNLRTVSMLTIALTDIERLSDHAENIIECAEELSCKKAWMSNEASNELKKMANDTVEAVNLSLDIFESGDFTKLPLVEKLESNVDYQETELVHNHVDRLMQSMCNPLASVIFTDVVTGLERCADHAINLAYSRKEQKKIDISML